MRTTIALAAVMTSLVAPVGMGWVAESRAQEANLPVYAPVEVMFRVDGRVYKASLAVQTYIPGILVEGAEGGASTSASLTITALDGGLVPPSIRAVTTSVPLRRNGLRAAMSAGVSIAAVPGGAFYYGNFSAPIAAGQRVTARVELETRRGRVTLLFTTVVVGLATPLA